MRVFYLSVAFKNTSRITFQNTDFQKKKIVKQLKVCKYFKSVLGMFNFLFKYQTQPVILIDRIFRYVVRTLMKNNFLHICTIQCRLGLASQSSGLPLN